MMNEQTNQQQQPQQAPQNGQGGLLDMQGDLNPTQIENLKKGFQIAQGIMYEKDVFAGLMKEAEGSSPPEALASITVQVLLKVEEKLGSVGFPVLAVLGIKIIDDLADALQKIGMAELSDQEVEQGLTLATQMYLSANQGKFDPAELEAISSQMAGGA